VAMEFWQDQRFRLHDRVRFTPEESGWRKVRLYP
jgi:pyridoxamine 5'-phosphate oxidase